ncbi:MFS-type transporter clz9-like [Haliotis rubra]|uniref:MFS-type transporter clz9-like n=1 Tax=Haliotis rubra TaxID=36100 RepID=UPI001EE58AF9|nr:MFS-type transporter clz9-like [Haliotis rubra]
MLRVKLPKVIPSAEKTKYRGYPDENITEAYSAVLKDGMAIRKAARLFGIPVSTLHDRLSGKIDITCTRPGPEPLFNRQEEEKLVDHVKSMGSYGFGYTRNDVITIATDLGVSLGKIEDGKQLSLRWFYAFLKRWPDLNVQQPKSLKLQRAKATTEENVANYYSHLETILDFTTTVIGCANAIGNALPPFFMFKGQRMREELLEGSLPGTAGTVSETGWSNSQIFRNYISDHFLKYSMPATKEKPVLILFDGHRSHVSVALSEWARKRNLILFVPPAHTSHILQPMDVGCFGPFERIYCNIRHEYLRENAAKRVQKHSICRLGCKAYSAALTPANIQAFFRKCGISPFDKHAVNKINFVPATVYKKTENAAMAGTENQTKATIVLLTTSASELSTQRETNLQTTSKTTVSNFFQRLDNVIFEDPNPTKKRNVMSAIVGGKAITETATLQKMKDHEAAHPPPLKKTRGKSTGKSAEPLPRTSGTKSSNMKKTLQVSDSDSEIVDDDEEVCCKCKLFQPVEVRSCVSLIFVKWAQCTHPTCQHLVHLGFCTPVKTVRCKSEYWCPCHDERED